MLRFLSRFKPFSGSKVGGLNRFEWVDMLRFRHIITQNNTACSGTPPNHHDNKSFITNIQGIPIAESTKKAALRSPADPQQMLIFWELLIFRFINVGLIFLVTRKRLTYHAAITDGIACRPLNYGVLWNACET